MTFLQFIIFKFHGVDSDFSVPAGNYMFKVNNRNTRTRSETCSKLTIKTLDRRQWCCSGVFIVKFKHISNLNLVYSIVNFEQVNVGSNIHQCKVNNKNIGKKVWNMFKINYKDTRTTSAFLWHEQINVSWEVLSRISKKIQSNLSIVGILYSGQIF